ncbi:MAG: ABC transporter permease, partial [Christensenellaceae bacterium]
GDTVNNSLETEFYKQFTYDISTPYNTSGFTKKMDAMKASGEIEAFEIYKIHYMTAIGAEANKDVKVYNFSENMTMTTIDTSGGRVVMSRSVAEFLGLKEGGTFTLNSGAQSFELTLSEIVDTAITKGVFLHTDLFEDIYGTSSAWIRADNITDELIDKINEAGGTAQATSVEDMWGYVEDKVSSINAMKYTLMIFAVLLSVVVLYNLSLLNINERTRDIATLKVLGFKRGKIALSLLFEIMLLTLAGTVCA